MEVLMHLKNAGFTVKLDGDGFTVKPCHLLTPTQRDFLKRHKAQIMDELLTTVVYTPAGSRMEIRARDANHQAWLIAHNHDSSIPVVFLDTD